jgi:galactokinase/mevalonate kinase-like predicted kinase
MDLVSLITSPDAAVRNQSMDQLCRTASTEELLAQCQRLDAFRRQSSSLYEQVRAEFFLLAIYRFHLPPRLSHRPTPLAPFAVQTQLWKRRYEEAITLLQATEASEGLSASLCSAYASAWHGLAFQTLAGQVRRSVRSIAGNRWMSRTGHPDEYPLHLSPQLLEQSGGVFPILNERTPVRMDLTHSCWSDIFFLGMDYPEGARVLNISVDLAVRDAQGKGDPAPPVEAFLRVIDEPVLRLTSVDLKSSADITEFDELFDFARDYLGLLKAAVIASGLVPPALEGATEPLSHLLARLTGRRDRGIELVSSVRDIPKGSRLAVSTNLLASLITACMRATGQIRSLTGSLEESERRLVAARAILGEWLGGSGGGWQDSGGVWPGIKLIEGAQAADGDAEYQVSRGRLLPNHTVLTEERVSAATRQMLQDSLILVHGGMAQDVGPVLEMVTEKYLLRAAREWEARQEAMQLFDAVVDDLENGRIQQLARRMESNFFGPIQTIIPWASNAYTESLIAQAREAFGEDFYGFWMLGGMSGGGMGFIVNPAIKAQAQDRLQQIMLDTKRRLSSSMAFAMDPVVYNFAINEHGTQARLLSRGDALMPASYYTLVAPKLMRQEAGQLAPARRAELAQFAEACRTVPALQGMVGTLFEHMMPRTETAAASDAGLDELLARHGFDAVQHEQIRADLRAGRVGLAQNRLTPDRRVEDVPADMLFHAAEQNDDHLRRLGEEALQAGAVAVITLAGGVGSRWTRGSGVVKSLNPFARMAGRHRNFVEVHLAKTRRAARLYGNSAPHLFTTSYLTQAAIAKEYPQHLRLSPGRSIGLRMIPMVRDLRFLWEESAGQVLDEQKQKMRDSVHAALMNWARAAGESEDYRDNLPAQCLHPLGHWYEVPNLLRNGVLRDLLTERPQLRHLLVHNIDTLGAGLDPLLLGRHIDSAAGMSVEVLARHIDDRGGGLALIGGRPQLIEGLALPSEELESRLSYYNSNTMWVDIDAMLRVFGLSRAELAQQELVDAAVRRVASRMPTYITLKDVKKRWGRGQEDVFPVVQWEKLWGDMTALPEWRCEYMAVPRFRGQQLKEPAQLDGWLRDGSAAWVDGQCDWD